MLFYFIYFAVTLFLSESIFRISAFGSFEGLTPFFYGFVLAAAGAFALICCLFRKRAARVCAYVLTVIIFVFYAVNLIYQHIFLSFLSVTQYSMGGDAISTYSTETLIGTSECWYFLLALLMPLIGLIVIGKREKADAKRAGKAVKKEPEVPAEENTASRTARHRAKRRPDRGPAFAGHSLRTMLLWTVLVVALQTGTVLALPLAGTGSYSPYDIYHDTFVLSMSQKDFGMLTSTRLELKGLFFGTGTGKLVAELPPEEPPVEPAPVQTAATGGAVDVPAPVVYEPNVLDIDFAALSGSTDDERLKALDAYFAGRIPTKKNEYTGMFKDYNVVVLLCESYSPYLLDAERTPMLYKMAHEGFVFKDYFGTIDDNTSNSEYTLITGLLPDTSLLGKGWDKFYDFNSCTSSKENLLPFCLGNVLKADGVRSLGFHYYWGNYYGRNKTHANFGYDMSFMGAGLSRTDDWPTSDLEMVKQAVPMILQPDENGEISRFGAYFLTFSGHMYYRFDSNRIARINKEVSDGLDMSSPARAYVSCNQELEKAVEYMVDEFDKAGVLDNTVFVVLPDHYPYALGLGPLSELAGKDLQADSFEKEFNQYKGVLMIWSPSMEGPIEVNTTCCELDILPTMLNLLGYDYDSRLLMGTDIFSDSEHVAILADRSFVTDKVYFNANDGTSRPREGGAEPEQSYIDRITAIVKNKFTVSTEVLYTDYYRHVFSNDQ